MFDEEHGSMFEERGTQPVDDWPPHWRLIEIAYERHSSLARGRGPGGRASQNCYVIIVIMNYLLNDSM